MALIQNDVLNPGAKKWGVTCFRIRQGSLDYPFWGDQTIQKYGQFEWFPLNSAFFWVGTTMTPVRLKNVFCRENPADSMVRFFDKPTSFWINLKETHRHTRKTKHFWTPKDLDVHLTFLFKRGWFLQVFQEVVFNCLGGGSMWFIWKAPKFQAFTAQVSGSVAAEFTACIFCSTGEEYLEENIEDVGTEWGGRCFCLVIQWWLQRNS